MSTLMAAVLSACSSTSHLEDGEQLYTGLVPIKYEGKNSSQHFIETQEELEAALATAPNGALFGSSFYRTIPYGLWIYNACADSNGAITKWVGKTFGKAPVLMSNVNPNLRASVAENVLQNHGYLRAKVDYDVIEGKPKTTKTDTVMRPRTAKIAYSVNVDKLFTIDTMRYVNFTPDFYRLLSKETSLLSKNAPFQISTLDEERTRIYSLFRNNGYYYFQKSHMAYMADTVKAKDKVQLQLNLADSLPENVTRQWVIGKMDVKVKRTFMEDLTDTISRRYMTVHYGGKRAPLRPGVILSDLKLRPNQLFSQDNYVESMSNLASKGIFSSSDITLTPRVLPDGTYATVPDTLRNRTTGESLAGAGILDMTINCTLDKPYDVSLSATYLGKTSGRMGPGLGLGFAMRNVFHGGEILSFNIRGSYEFRVSGATSAENSYDITADMSLDIPRLLLPNAWRPKRRRWFATPSTTLTVARQTVNRSGFFRRHILSGQLSYTFQPTVNSRHIISPLVVEYDRLASLSEDYMDKIINSPTLLTSINDRFLSKIEYNYTYTSNPSLRNPIYWTTTLTESSNLLALGYAIAGKKWNQKGKEFLHTPFAQFVKVETDFRKTWLVGEHSTVVGHVAGGLMYAFGNTDPLDAPFGEYFYIGGANSLRAFPARSIGPGSLYYDDSKLMYTSSKGQMKLLMNLEYRPHLFGSLYGALFMDMGNVWNVSRVDLSPIADGLTAEEMTILKEYQDKQMFNAKNLFRTTALGVGVGVRYDLDFFVLRLDWGFALHMPYDTGRSGYFNVPSFKKAQCLNIAIGYPF